MSRPLQIVLSIFGWWVLVVTPALLTIAGVYGDVGVDTVVGGALIATWIVGYLIQLAWMMVVVVHAVGHTRTWWLFVASLLPWTVDWSAAAGWGWGLVWIAVAGIATAAMILQALRTHTLETAGRSVTATVVKVLRNRMNVVINNVYIRRRVLLEIPGADGTPYEAVLPLLCEIGTMPSKGEKLRLRVDPKNPKHFALEPRRRDED